MLTSDICIVTIHKGNLFNLKKTIKSVNMQISQPKLHLVVASGVYNYQINCLRKKNRKFILNQDVSIYNAMNIAKKCAGKIPILYLNSGDFFFSKESLFFINKFIKKIYLNYVLIFATLLTNDNTYFSIKRKVFNKSSYLPHSSFICINDYFNKKINFDYNNKITADGIWMRAIIKKSRNVIKYYNNLAIQNLNGQSSMPSFKNIKYRWHESKFSAFKEFVKLSILIFLKKSLYFRFIYFYKYTFSNSIKKLV